MDQERTYKWIQDRLRELHSGTLSEQDLARLKEMALTDPFVADAMEGFDAHPDVEHANRLYVIEQKIKQTKRERRRWLVPNLTVTAIAASVMVIVATYAVISRMQKDNEETLFVFVAPDSLSTTDSITPDIAMEKDARYSAESEEEKAEAANNNPPPGRTQESITDNKESKTPPTVADQSAKKGVVNEIESKSTTTQSVPAAAAPADDDIAPSTKDLAISSKNEMARSKTDEGYYANQMNPVMMQSRITGRVLETTTGVPLAAKIIVNFSNQAFYADGQGYFELFIPDQTAVLQVSYSGLIDSTFVIRQGDENIQVGLSTGALIPNQAIAGAKNKGPVTSITDPLIESHLLFSSYVHANALLQLTPEPSSARRKVVIEFKVKKDGRPTDIAVVESSRDKSYDNEALRLIKDGPGWVCIDGEYPCVRKYTFYFR